MNTTSEWWAKNAHELCEVENTDRYVTQLYGRQVEDGWEYAIVRWRYKVPSLLWLFKNGTILEGDGDE